MAKCIVCGKKGLFLKVNVYGRCKDCEERHKQEEKIKMQKEQEHMRLLAEAREREKREKAESYFNQLSQIITMVKDFDSETSYTAEEMMQKCDDLIVLLKKYTEYEYFDLIVKQNMTDGSDLDKTVGFVWVLPLAAYFPTKVPDYLKTMIQYLTDDAVKWEKRWSNRAKGIEEDDALHKIRLLTKSNMEKSKNKKDTGSIQEKDPQVSKNLSPVEPVVREKIDNYELLPDCIVTDIETSGLVYNRNSIIEIAAIKIIDGKIHDTYSSLIHRDKPLDSKVASLTGITTSMLRDCDYSLSTVMSEYREFVGDLPLVGHNIKSFDIKFINAAYAQLGENLLSNPCIDTLKMSYEYFFDANSHKLGDLARFANIPVGTSHRALGDCETTLNLLKCMADIGAVSILKWSKNGKEYTGSDEIYPIYAKKNYPENICFKFHQKLISTGYLIEADKKVVLNSIYKIPDLQALLSRHNLPTKGTKKALVDRIVENLDIQELNLPTIYVPSEKGNAHFEKYQNAINEMVQNAF